MVEAAVPHFAMLSTKPAADFTTGMPIAETDR